jgi:hypothetical protein
LKSKRELEDIEVLLFMVGRLLLDEAALGKSLSRKTTLAERELRDASFERLGAFQRVQTELKRRRKTTMKEVEESA